MDISLAELAELAQGTIMRGEASAHITGFSTVDEAEPGDVTFLGNPRYLPKLKKSNASAVLVATDFKDAPANLALIAVENPTLAFQKIIDRFGPSKLPFIPGIHPSAVIGETASLDRTKVFIAPHVVIEDDVVIGDGCAIHAGAFIGRGSCLGQNTVIHANAVIKDRCLLGNRVIIHSCSVIGSDGFGYEFSGGRHVKVNQVGIVQIDDDVEIGSCTTIDRARFGRTWIREGSKIDNLVQIAHNVRIGRHCLICAQVGISGSATLEDCVVLGGQAGVAGHITIGKGVKAGGRAGLNADLAPGSFVTGNPAIPVMLDRRIAVLNQRLPELFRRVGTLEEQLADAKKSSS